MSESNVPIGLVAAMSRNRVIGIDHHLPWHLPQDLAHFKRMTLNKPIIMGRTTFISIGRPLPSRYNIVLTRDTTFEAEGVTVCHSLEDALSEAQRYAVKNAQDEVMVIGGGEVYAQALPYADHLHLTEIALTLDGDTHFPPIDERIWEAASREAGEPCEGQPAFTFVTYVRRHDD